MVSLLLHQVVDFFPRAVTHVTFPAEEPNPPGLVTVHLVDFPGFLNFAFSNCLKRKCLALSWETKVAQKSLPPGGL